MKRVHVLGMRNISSACESLQIAEVDARALAWRHMGALSAMAGNETLHGGYVRRFNSGRHRNGSAKNKKKCNAPSARFFIVVFQGSLRPMCIIVYVGARALPVIGNLDLDARLLER